MYRLTSIFMFLCCSFVYADPIESNPSEICSKMLDYTYHELPDWGVLTTRDGALYLDLSDEYIHELVTFIRSEGFEAPENIGVSSALGAHIGVIEKDEVSEFELPELVENGEVIYFTAKECRVAPCEISPEAYLVIVEAPELDRIRQKYGLPKRAHEFYITIGIKPIPNVIEETHINF